MDDLTRGFYKGDFPNETRRGYDVDAGNSGARAYWFARPKVSSGGSNVIPEINENVVYPFPR